LYTLAGVLRHAGQASAQTAAPAKPPLNIPAPVAGAAPVTVEKIVVHGASLEGNLEGDSPDRSVIVYLPPSYEDAVEAVPVLYALHGYSINNEKWTTEIKTPQTIEGAFATGTREMIVVIADAQTLHNGSMYSNSVTTGNWEDFISRDLVSYIDSHYRTIANRMSRGIAGPLHGRIRHGAHRDASSRTCSRPFTR
jgi:enterochelin esterase-like enzyme